MTKKLDSLPAPLTCTHALRALSRRALHRRSAT